MNSLYDRNLKLLFARYPDQQRRLTEFLNQASDLKDQDPRKFDKALNIKKRDDKLKCALLPGYFHRDSLRKLLADPELSQIKALYLIENNVDVIKHQLETEDWSAALANPSYNFLFGYKLEDLESVFYATFKNPEISMNYMSVMLEFHPQLSQAEYDFYKQIPQIFKQATTHYTGNLGSIQDYKEGVRATVANTDLLRSCPGIYEIKNTNTKPAVLVGAGPSLDKDMELLKANRDKFLVIAADASVKKLIDAGIKADYCVSIERFNSAQIKFWEGLYKADPNLLPELVAFPVVHEESFKKFPGNIRIVYRNYAYYVGFEQALPKGMMHSFASCMHLGLRLAHWIGSREFVLLGCDMCYDEVAPGVYRSHAEGLSYEEWAEGKPQSWFEENMDETFKPFELRTTYSGKTVLTHRVYRNFARQWAMEAVDPKFANSLIQCADSPEMSNIAHASFAEVCEAASGGEVKEITYKKINKPAPAYHVWIKNLKALSRRFKELRETLHTSKKMSNEELQTLYIYLRNMVHSELFTSNWVIQCSTREYYQAWNQVNIFDLDLTTDTPEKRANRITAYNNLLTVLSTSAAELAGAIEQGAYKQ